MGDRVSRWFVVGILVVGVLVLAARAVRAQSGGGYELSWSTVDGGGGTSAGGNFRVAGTVGQPDAGSIAGGSYELAGGFWGGGAAAVEHDLYIPLILKESA
jgi:hypothetical protein